MAVPTIGNMFWVQNAGGGGKFRTESTPGAGRLTRGQRLDRKGIYHIEVDGILAFLSERQSKNADVREAMRPLINAAPILIAHERDRVRRGQFAEGTTPKAYSGKKVAISEEYARLCGVDPKKSWWLSRDFHAATNSRAGAGYVSGEMWRGVQARGISGGIQIEFNQAYTESRGKVVKTQVAVEKNAQRHRRNRYVYKVFRAKAKNREKAFGVFVKQNVNVIEPMQREIDALAASMLADVQTELGRTLFVKFSTVGSAGDPVLFGKLTNGWRK